MRGIAEMTKQEKIIEVSEGFHRTWKTYLATREGTNRKDELNYALIGWQTLLNELGGLCSVCREGWALCEC